MALSYAIYKTYYALLSFESDANELNANVVCNIDDYF